MPKQTLRKVLHQLVLQIKLISSRYQP